MRILALLLAVAWAGFARAAEPELVFSLKRWDGEYATSDVPGGVKVTPTLGSIHTVRADGTGLKTIVPPSSGTDYPTASPDGKWLYFQSRKDGPGQIYRCKRDGSELAIVTPPEKLAKALAFPVKDAYGYAFSDDGRNMVLTVHDGSSGRVVVSELDGTKPRLLAPHLGYIYMARLNPAGDAAVFSGPAKGYRLLSVKLPDGEPRMLTPDHPDSYAPRFTPDGKSILFLRRDGDLYRIDADGTNLKRLTEGNKYVEFRLSPMDSHGSTDGPDLSADGKRIAFIALADGVPNVFTVNMDGTNRKQLTTRKSACGRVKWSPDGKRIAFVAFEGKWPQLFTIPADGGEPKQLTKIEGAVYFANWLP
jgi:Tol biopolymer transport system component